MHETGTPAPDRQAEPSDRLLQHPRPGRLDPASRAPQVWPIIPELEPHWPTVAALACPSRHLGPSPRSGGCPISQENLGVALPGSLQPGGGQTSRKTKGQPLSLMTRSPGGGHPADRPWLCPRQQCFTVTSVKVTRQLSKTRTSLQPESASVISPSARKTLRRTGAGSGLSRARPSGNMPDVPNKRLLA